MEETATKAYVKECHATLFETFASGKTKNLQWRRWQLQQLYWMIHDNEDRMCNALKKDLNRHVLESSLADITTLKTDILTTLSNLGSWTAISKPKAGLLFGTISGAQVRKQPLGVSLIIGAWNFPLLLLLQPLIAAIAAGCCVVLKPSELASEVESLLVELVPKYLDTQATRVVTAGPSEMPFILDLRWSHIFFTGSSKIARFVAAAAAKHLTPVVLELGGQGPCIVSKTADVDFAAKRITYAKFTNAGQICLSVNHVYAEPEIVQQLIDRMKFWNDHFLSEGDGCMTRIINERNFDRLIKLLDATQGETVYGGKHDRERKFIAPTIVSKVATHDSLMSEELFGPICPIITCSIAEAVTHINKLPMGNPLALYIFSGDHQVTERVISETLSGGVTVNNVFMHAGVPDAPFGGVGESGHGAYHGVHGIDAFSHRRTIVRPPQWLDKLMSFTYPPYNVQAVSKVPKPGAPRFRRAEDYNDFQSQDAQAGYVSKSVVLTCLVFSAAMVLIKAGTVPDLARSSYWVLASR